MKDDITLASMWPSLVQLIFSSCAASVCIIVRFPGEFAGETQLRMTKQQLGAQDLQKFDECVHVTCKQVDHLDKRQTRG